MDYLLLLVELVTLERMIIASLIEIVKIKFKALEDLGETIINASMSCD